MAEGLRPPIPEPAKLPGGGAELGGLDAYLALLQKCWAQSPEDRPPFGIILDELSSLYASCTGGVLEEQQSGGSLARSQPDPAPRPRHVLCNVDVTLGRNVQPSPFSVAEYPAE